MLVGQLRSGNLTWDSGKIGYDKARRMFGSDDPPSPIATVLEWLIKPYALHGGVDMFIYIQVDLKFLGADVPRKFVKFITNNELILLLFISLGW
jgi:hypothetical protein